MTTKKWVDIKRGDMVEYCTTLPGLSGGSCRSVFKTVERVNLTIDKVYFTDGTTYHHEENPNHTLVLLSPETRIKHVQVP